jgi:hypothetical protein
MQYAMCGVRNSNSCSVRQCTAKRTAVSGSVVVCGNVCGSVRLSGCACGSVRLSSGVAVCVESGSEHIFK